jgi:long-subunit acyl-CoA synthetase (AMP-forming)
VFTSGATGPAKGVVYRHRQLQAQLETLRKAYQLTHDDPVVAAFPPFVLYGPALGATSAVPRAAAPVVDSAADLTADQRAALAGVRLLLSAGAPVAADLLRALRAVLPAAEAHTPYGMTEVLPVTDITLAGIEAAGPGEGVCVGGPVPGVEVRIQPLPTDGAPAGDLTGAAGVTGEVRVRARHARDRYDRLWATGRDAATERGWHASGDVGHLDEQGRLWIEGRVGHVIHTDRGPVTPVGIEQRSQAVAGVRTAAAVGVGPPGTQQVVVVLVPDARPDRHPAPHLAATPLAAAVRAAVPVEVAAVLVTDTLPVDIRHAAKIDRVRVGAWAERVLAGERAGRRP